MNVSYRRDALLNEKVRELTHMSRVYIGKNQATTTKNNWFTFTCFTIRSNVTLLQTQYIIRNAYAKKKLIHRNARSGTKKKLESWGGARARHREHTNAIREKLMIATVSAFSNSMMDRIFIQLYLLNEMNQLHFAFDLQCISVDICCTDAFHRHMQLKIKISMWMQQKICCCRCIINAKFSHSKRQRHF